MRGDDDHGARPTRPAAGTPAPRGARPQRTRRRLGWSLAVLWAAFIFWQSSTPDAGGMLDWLPPGSDKVAHAVAFLVLAGLLTLATGRPLVAAALAVLYGASDEVHQAFVPGRSSDALDLVADTAGAALGAWLVARALRRRGRGAV
ncbi:MAG TPA: VanZ family protein [Trueperaceae bacterium]